MPGSLYLTAAAGAKCHVVAVKGLPVLPHSVVFIFVVLGITEPILISRKNRVPFKPSRI